MTYSFRGSRLIEQQRKETMAFFSKTLHALLVQKGWTQSTLARKVWGDVRTDARGYQHVVGKDKISKYLLQKSFPEPIQLKKIADVLGVEVKDLLPPDMLPTFYAKPGDFNMQFVGGDYSEALIQFDQIVPVATALQIASILGRVAAPAPAPLDANEALTRREATDKAANDAKISQAVKAAEAARNRRKIF